READAAGHQVVAAVRRRRREAGAERAEQAELGAGQRVLEDAACLAGGLDEDVHLGVAAARPHVEERERARQERVGPPGGGAQHDELPGQGAGEEAAAGEAEDEVAAAERHVRGQRDDDVVHAGPIARGADPLVGGGLGAHAGAELTDLPIELGERVGRVGVGGAVGQLVPFLLQARAAALGEGAVLAVGGAEAGLDLGGPRWVLGRLAGAGPGAGTGARPVAGAVGPARRREGGGGGGGGDIFGGGGIGRGGGRGGLAAGGGIGRGG